MLDEADQMLERGFAESVEEILAASFKPGESGHPASSLSSIRWFYLVSKTCNRHSNSDSQYKRTE